MGNNSENKIYKINKAFLEFEADPNTNINNLITLCGELLKADCVVYSSIENNKINLLGQWNMPVAALQAEGSIFRDILKSGAFEEISGLSRTPYTKNDTFIKQNHFEVCAGIKTKNNNGSLCLFFKQDKSVSEEDKQIIGIIASAIAVEEKRKNFQKEKELYQARLIQSEKMAAIGTLASGVAHEFNNMLQVIDGYAKYARKSKKEEDIEEAFQIILETSKEAVSIIKNLLSFSGHSGPDKETCGISELADTVLLLTEKQMKKHGISINRIFNETPPVTVNRAEIQQVFLSILMNAKDALLPKGGDIEVLIKKNNNAAEISFTDTGKGISGENIPRIFEPFYTTKGAIGSGSTPGAGLGLFVAYGIIQKHGGTINIKSQPGKSTTVTIKLPAQDINQIHNNTSKTNKNNEILQPGPINILVVDDETNIRKLLSRHLKNEGYTVKDTDDIKKAVTLMKNEAFNIIFLDLIISGSNGPEMIREIKTHAPESRVILMSGIEDKHLSGILHENKSYQFLPKPFTLEDINIKIKLLTGDNNE